MPGESRNKCLDAVFVWASGGLVDMAMSWLVTCHWEAADFAKCPPGSAHPLRATIVLWDPGQVAASLHTRFRPLPCARMGLSALGPLPGLLSRSSTGDRSPRQGGQVTAEALSPAGGHVTHDLQLSTDWPQAQSQSRGALGQSPTRPGLLTTLTLDHRDTGKCG